ncbi:hypothetical protein J7E97_05990 [Streptomyces sp. ISL-66]|uniref:hypothetical protein n=1 Tax=Streptomyces sp. ISL-66 TaxID=2819186 RepID=UPI001BEB0293|nr:hypothetical protein [Streptomyces sp. ISL-66]MBT2467432.1 hypothetical protein [Streptomyces sp. ISL-66]
MTNSSAPTTGNRRTAVVLLVLTVLLLLPPVLFWYHSAQEALAHKSGSDWRGNHRTKQGLEYAALVIAGVPALGALTGWACGSAKGRPGTWTVGGAFVGTLVLWGVLIVAVFVSLSRAQFFV